MLFHSLLVCLPLVSSRVISRLRETPLLSSQEGAPGIGLHFTTSYATAAIRYDNGTIVDLVRIEADAEYIDLMSRWANPASKQDCSDPWKEFQCSIARRKRNVNKWLGRPATVEVGILSSFVVDLKAAVEDTLDFPITRVFPVFPMLEGMEEDDIQDALEYTGLDWLLAERRSYHIFWETNAAFAGLGYGLCKSRKNLLQCEEQERDMHLEPVLFLNFDNSSFAASLQGMENAYWDWTMMSEVRLDLGWWNMPVYEVPRAKFLARIQQVIVNVGSSMVRPPTKIILLGEYADDEDFRETVKAAIWELLEYDASPLLEVNMMKRGEPWMLAARGAAEMAGRAEYWNQYERRRPGEGLETFVVEL
ncbi:uncharacterized protein BDR25DRAFT_302876 [Lindgomyces ingoldianus]|uniref:Uncharacterized protein n=1 Tax=Lindgomyces ingoldianus TaxID=673940 RepID=A0ACB6QZX5_9PLEO|nr:uncharacterized protein BDR25DRAFT_302876 [Lindgomyces ingoldianus]KAF2472090.1 hypothetical protein BDR25DRAFT_302876 [Lindgomyces ingoldianus]